VAGRPDGVAPGGGVEGGADRPALDAGFAGGRGRPALDVGLACGTDRLALDADVAIAGGGPAGAAAAIACARAGLRVVLLERSALPRERPGETLHPGVEAPLRELGVLERVLHAGFARHPGVWVGWGEPPHFAAYGADEEGPWHGFQAWRADFDALLVARAVELGAVVHERCRALAPLERDGRVAGIETAAGELRARHVIDAAGGGHWLARSLGLELDRRSPPLIARFGYAEGDCPARDEAPAMLADGAGWTWTARVGEGLYAWTRLGLQGDTSADAPAELAGLRPRGRARSADVSWRVLDQPAGPGYVAAGDAAVVLDPASSHGVLRALLSGLHAARLVLALRAGGDERRLNASYGDVLTRWFDHDASVLRDLYTRLPGAPAWLHEPQRRVESAGRR
jgi:flavin-dependent dehydrogenase